MLTATAANLNDLAPISTIPVELIAAIFQYIVDEIDFPHYASHKAFTPPHFCEKFNFTYVSAEWRAIALSTPAIWCSLYTYPIKCLELLVSRSDAVGLSALFYFAGDHQTMLPWLGNFLKDHAFRIQDLRLYGSAFNLSPLLANLYYPFPQLQVLLVTCEDNITLPPSALPLVSGLQRLHAVGCDLDWKASYFRGVVNLRISGPPSRPSWSELRDVLTLMPALRILRLRDALPQPSQPAPASTIQLTLVNLQHISIWCSFDGIATFTKIYRFPSAIFVDISLNDTPFPTPRSSFNFLSEFFYAVKSFQAREKQFYKVLSLRDDFEDNFHLEAWYQIGHKSSSKRPFLSISIDCLALADHSSLLCYISSYIDLNHTKHLFLKTSMPTPDLVEFFGKLPAVCCVYLRQRCKGFLEGLTVDEEERTGNTTPVIIPFPSLTSVRLERIRFKSDEDHHVAMDYLCRCLKTRAESAPVRKLVIKDCYFFDSSLLVSLQDVVPDTHWDGVTHSQ